MVIIILTLLLLQTSFATLNPELQDNYRINDIQQLKSVKINQEPLQKYHVKSYVDDNDVDEYPSGGVTYDIDNDVYEYILPYNLGYGHHSLCIVLLDDYGDIVSEESYGFNILHDEEDELNEYDGKEDAPYYYETDNDNEYLDSIIPDYDDEGFMFVNVNLGELTLLNIDDYYKNIAMEGLCD